MVQTYSNPERGKAVKKQNNGILNYQPLQIPAPIITQYTNVQLFIDILWVNGSPYFHTILDSHQQQKQKNMTHGNTDRHQHVPDLDFHHHWIKGDPEFSCIANKILPAHSR